MMYYWIQEATTAGAQGAAASLPSSLLTGGVVVGILGLILAQLRHTQTLQQTRELEAQRAREAALQKYLEQVGKLLIEQSLRDATSGDNPSTVARAQTLAVLEGLDPDRKRILLQFLYESNLIAEKSVISLSGANLSKANLSEANLHKAKLSGANLSGANLSGADLSSAYLVTAALSKAKLIRANLRRVYLLGATLSGADLRKAKLRSAYLVGAYLVGADLSGADLSSANLEEADLSKAKHLTQEQIDSAHGDETTKLPEHRQRPARWKHHQRLAHWSSKGSEEQSKEG